jgi:hypothetical protein
MGRKIGTNPPSKIDRKRGSKEALAKSLNLCTLMGSSRNLAIAR